MISYSKIASYKKCPRRYYLEYVEQKLVLPAPILLEGKEEHLKIEQEKKPPAFFEKVFQKYFINPIFEERIQANCFTIDIEGVIDCYSISNSNRTAYIADWKLWQLPETPEQFLFYSLLLSKKYEDLEIFICYAVSIRGEFYKIFSFNREQIEQYENEVIAIAEEIENATEFPMKPSQNCSFCPFLYECFENKALAELKIQPLRTLEEAQKVAQALVIAENFLDNIKKMLKEFMLEQGISEIVTDENRVYLVPSISLRIGKRKDNNNKAQK